MLCGTLKGGGLYGEYEIYIDTSEDAQIGEDMVFWNGTMFFTIKKE